MRKLGLPEPPHAHTPPHVLNDSVSYSTLGSYFSFLFFTFLRQFDLMSSWKVHLASDIHCFLHVRCFFNHFPWMGHYHQQWIEKEAGPMEMCQTIISGNKHFGKTCVFFTVRQYIHISGQIIATSHDLTPNSGLVRETPLFQGNLGWWNLSCTKRQKFWFPHFWPLNPKGPLNCWE